MQYTVEPVGEQAVSLKLPNRIDPIINQTLQLVISQLQALDLPGIQAMIPAFHTLLIQIDPQLVTSQAITGKIQEIMQQLDHLQSQPRRIIELPVCYDRDLGPDIVDVAKFAGVSTTELIKLHTAKPYLIYFLGFLPGFAYLGGIAKQIAMPRLATPRVKIPAGSVGIAGMQTGFYPVDSPGGWRIIGQTPLTLFSQTQPKPVYRAGDYIQFKAIDRNEFQKLQTTSQNGDYHWQISTKKVAE